MKSIFCISVMLGLSLVIHAQDSIFQSSKIIQVGLATKDQLFGRAINWINKDYKGSKTTVQFTDKDAGKILAKGELDYQLSGFTTGKGKIYYSITINVKAEKLKVEINNFSLSLYHGDQLTNCWNFSDDRVITCSITKKDRKNIKADMTTYEANMISDFELAMNKQDDQNF